MISKKYSFLTNEYESQQFNISSWVVADSNWPSLDVGYFAKFDQRASNLSPPITVFQRGVLELAT